jgi:predicted DNA-binding protein (UPF0251 family)
MARPQRCLCRGIKFKPKVSFFKPQGIPLVDLEEVEISLEELESLRLRHINKLEQTEAAEKMKTSQSTYQRILSSAYQKIVDALVNGKAIKFIKHY